jgi:hypothetical protein
VPISVGSQKTAVNGDLYWTPDNSKAPVGAIGALVIIVVGGSGLMLRAHRRRRRGVSRSVSEPW